MDVRCKCGSDCLRPASYILKYSKDLYSPCSMCNEFKLKKFTPLVSQMNLSSLDGSFGKCSNCGKRHLDIVMAQILKIMIEHGLKDKDSNLRNVCVPLITPAYPTKSTPYLPEDSLVILSGEMDEKCADEILKKLPEVKGVLKGYIKDTVGIKNSTSTPNTYEVLSGCDVRCDIVYTPWDVICIYKYQSQIHIEFPKPLSPKIKNLKKVLDKYDKPTVLDSTCGPGTLGIAALKAGAGKVIFNDLWYPAAENTIINLELNGFPVEMFKNKKGLIASGYNFEVYCLDVKELGKVLNNRFNICLVDTFPRIDPGNFVTAVKDICEEILIL
jgi:glutaredoxin-related protein